MKYKNIETIELCKKCKVPMEDGGKVFVCRLCGRVINKKVFIGNRLV